MQEQAPPTRQGKLTRLRMAGPPLWRDCPLAASGVRPQAGQERGANGVENAPAEAMRSPVLSLTKRAETRRCAREMYRSYRSRQVHGADATQPPVLKVQIKRSLSMQNGPENFGLATKENALRFWSSGLSS